MKDGIEMIRVDGLQGQLHGSAAGQFDLRIGGF